MRILFVTVLVGLVAAAPAGATRLSTSDRAAINRTLDAFVASAVKRQNVRASYDLVTSQLSGATTRAAWAKGELPVYPYPARGTSFHTWTIDYVLPNDVAFELMLQPRRRNVNPIAFTGEVKKIRGRWLVDSFYPAATFDAKRSKVVGPRDFTAQSLVSDAGESRLGAAWFALPGALLALIVLVPAGVILEGWRRNRRAGRAYRDPEHQRRYEEYARRLRARSLQS
jgi:hypothetical protein